MPFTMKGAFVEAVVERGDKSFDLSVVNGFANSLSNMVYTLRMGAASSIQLNFTPTLEQAKQMIESGILGVGFPAVEGQFPTGNFSSVQGVLKSIAATSNLVGGGGVAGLANKFVTVAKTGKGGNGEGPPIEPSTAVSLRVKWWYDDYGDRSVSPTFYGMLQAPQVSFGAEIAITMQASTTAAYNAATIDQVSVNDGVSAYDVVESIASTLGVRVKWTGTAESIAKDRVLREQQDVTLLMYLNEVIERIGCIAYFGDDGEENEEVLLIRCHKDINASKPVCSLVMYKQIDPDADSPQFGVTAVDTDISHAFLAGMQRGSSHTTIDPETKEITINRNDAESVDRDMVGGTAGGKLQQGHSTSGVKTGHSPGPEDSGFRNLGTVSNSDNPNMFDENQKYVEDSLEKAWKMVLGGPAVPFILPASLVYVDIGGIRHVSGLYKLVEVEHSIGQDGAESKFTIHKAMGFTETEKLGMSENTQKPATLTPQGVELQASLTGGIIESVGGLV